MNNVEAFVRWGGALAGHAKAAIQRAAGSVGSLFGLVKVKAHQTLRWDMEASALWAASGNEVADAAAKAGASMHPRPSPVERATFLRWWTASVGLDRLIGKVLLLFPTAAEQFGGSCLGLLLGAG